MSREQRRERMRALLALREREGLTYRELAEVSGESRNTLAWWSSRLRKEQHFVEVVAGAAEADGEPLTVELANGHRVLVPACFDEGELARLLRVVAAC